MASIYISYSSKDIEVVTRIAQGLKERGHTVFYAHESIAPGQDWNAALSTALKSSEVLSLY